VNAQTQLSFMLLAFRDRRACLRGEEQRLVEHLLQPELMVEELELHWREGQGAGLFGVFRLSGLRATSAAATPAPGRASR
jgi:hypothetical protein